MFQAFRGLDVKNHLIEKGVRLIAPLTLAVYLIHEHDHFRSLLWQWLNPGGYAESPWMVAYVLGCGIGIFCICCLIEWIRSKLFRLCRIDRLVNSLCDKLQSRVERWLGES